ncbi:MAG TPA: sigma-70 family RNA polymerase sigma factor [Polyangiaceae bacterium]|nr:sigma-70 family RNA polymerase sigma factor [Polyangiaceae bacterium]
MSVAVPRPETVAPGSRVRAAGEPDRPPGIEELFRRHAPAVASLGLAMLQSVEEADDLVQDVFLRAWRAFDRLEDPEGARPWVMTIAVRLARTRLRRRKVTRLLFRIDEPDFEQVASPGVLPEHRDLVKRLYMILDKLPVELRIAWVLRYVQAETVQSVAELCGWSLSTAKRRIQIAHERVTAKLEAATQGAGISP